MDYPWTTDYLFKSQFKRIRFPSRVRFFTKITCHYKMSWWPMKNRYLKIGYPSHLTESWLKFQNHLKVMSGMGCRHSSVDLSALSILLPRVRLPSTLSMLLSFIVIVLYLSLQCEKRTKIKRKEAGFVNLKKLWTIYSQCSECLHHRRQNNFSLLQQKNILYVNVFDCLAVRYSFSSWVQPFGSNELNSSILFVCTAGDKAYLSIVALSSVSMK